MTLEDYFLKTAASVLEQNKLAGIGDLLRNMKGFSGLGTALTSGGLSGAGAHISDAYKALDSVARNKLIGQLAGGAAGAIGGYAVTDDDAGILQHLSNMAVGAGMGGLGGGALAARLQAQPGVATAAPPARATAPAPAPAATSPAPAPAAPVGAAEVAPAPSNAGQMPEQPSVKSVEPIDPSGDSAPRPRRRRAPSKDSLKDTAAKRKAERAAKKRRGS